MVDTHLGNVWLPRAIPAELLGAPRPTQDEINAMWQEEIFRPLGERPAAVDSLVDAMRRIYVNGGAHFASFGVSPSPTFDWYLARGTLNEAGFFEAFLGSAALEGALPSVTKAGNLLQQPRFRSVPSLTLDGEIALQMAQGGAYTSGMIDPARAKVLAQSLAKALIGDRYSDVDAFVSGTAWSDWFHAVAWDSTWVIVDSHARRISILVTTDTD